MFLLIALSFSKLYTTSFEEKSFLSWMRTNNNIYTGDEYHFRFGIYLANSQYVQQFNRRNNKSYKIGLNKFACLTPQEAKSLLGVPVSRNFNGQKVAPKLKITDDIPDRIDWREKGAVYDVQDQGSCGSCWAFATIQAQESSHAIATGELIGLSQQNLVDCANGDCKGCHGGWPDKAFRYVIEYQNGQFNLDSDYPYTAVDGNCKFDATIAVGGIKGYVQTDPNDEEDLLQHVARYGPTTVGIDASGSGFMGYSSGIYDRASDCDPYGINHGVCAVGYGEENDIKYWIVRNSWGSMWGEAGYIKMGRNINMCGIALRAYSVYFDNE